MIIWFALFVVIIFISFILAYLSMRDYQEIPEKKLQYSLFLIQNPQTLNNELLDNLHGLIKKGEIISLERLFKGNQSALVIFGPKNILQNLTNLDLLELEDYTGVKQDDVVAWETTLKDHEINEHIFNQLPEFESSEQFWWQIILQTYSKNYLSEFVNTLKGVKDAVNGRPYRAQVRAILVAPTEERRKNLKVLLENLSDNLIKIPRPFSSSQIFEFYKSRSFTPASFGVSLVTSTEVLSLLGKR